MSLQYRRGQHAAPESYEAKLRTAWLEHSENFRPIWDQLRKHWRELAEQVKPGNKKSELRYFKLTHDEAANYIHISMKSFEIYLHKLLCAYVEDQLEKADKEKLSSSMSLSLAKSFFWYMPQPKPKRKKRTKAKKKHGTKKINNRNSRSRARNAKNNR